MTRGRADTKEGGVSSSERIRSGLEIAGNGAVVMIAVLLLWTQIIRPDRPVGGPVEALEDVTMSASMLTKQLGTAERILLEFSDFQCPYCAEYALEELPRIKRELVDSGKLSYGFLHFPLQRIHPEAATAAVAAECAGRQGRFWEMHDWLFASQELIAFTDFQSQAFGLGLDDARFHACMLGEDAALAVEADYRQGVELGVGATPTFFIGRVGADGVVELTRRISGQVTLEGLEDALAENGRGWGSWLPWRW